MGFVFLKICIGKTESDSYVNILTKFWCNGCFHHLSDIGTSRFNCIKILL